MRRCTISMQHSDAMVCSCLKSSIEQMMASCWKKIHSCRYFEKFRIIFQEAKSLEHKLGQSNDRVASLLSVLAFHRWWDLPQYPVSWPKRACGHSYRANMSDELACYCRHAQMGCRDLIWDRARKIGALLILTVECLSTQSFQSSAFSPYLVKCQCQYQYSYNDKIVSCCRWTNVQEPRTENQKRPKNDVDPLFPGSING